MEASVSSSNIPNDIIRLILSVKYVIRCQCVCKQWHSLIQDSDFNLSYRGGQRVIILSDEFKSPKPWNPRIWVRSTSHDLRLQRHKQPFGEADLLIPASDIYGGRLCSCNGLVLVVAERDILLWNPSTRCSTKVFERPYPEELNPVFVAGLCYDSCIRDYKVVLLGYYFGDPFVIYASLNHKEWRPVQFPYGFVSTRDGVDFRNTFHWWVSDNRYRNFSLGNSIVYFDPVRDEFRILPTPPGLRENSSIVGLGVIDDCLSMACMVQGGGEEPKTKTIQVLIMKEYGRQESWMIAFAIQMPEYETTYEGLTFYSQTKNAQDEVLFLRSVDWYGQQLYVYDQKKDELKREVLDFQTTPNSRYFVIGMCFYVETLACPGQHQHLNCPEYQLAG